MKMTASDQIIEVLDSLCEKFGIALDWSSENIIPYVTTLAEKLVNYELWTSVAMLVLAVMAGVVSTVLISKPSVRKFMWEGEIEGVFACIGIICLAFFSIITIGIEIVDIIKCLTFPELYIFEYIQGVINSGS
jgi:hypothetical protein